MLLIMGMTGWQYWQQKLWLNYSKWMDPSTWRRWQRQVWFRRLLTWHDTDPYTYNTFSASAQCMSGVEWISCAQLGCNRDWSLKGKFPQTTMWTGWVESNFRNPTVECYANFDNPFKRTNCAKLCMSPSPDRTLPESVMSQENNSPLTLHIEFHNCFCWDINSPVDQVQS